MQRARGSSEAQPLQRRSARKCASLSGRSSLAAQSWAQFGHAKNYSSKLLKINKLYGGGRGIRTPVRVSPQTVFKTAGFNHSPIPPSRSYLISLVYRAVTASSRMASAGRRCLVTTADSSSPHSAWLHHSCGRLAHRNDVGDRPNRRSRQEMRGNNIDKLTRCDHFGLLPEPWKMPLFPVMR